MTSNNKIVQLKQQTIQKYTRSTGSDDFLALIHSVGSTQLAKLGERNRVYTPERTLSMFLSQVLNSDRSCQNAVNELAVRRLANHQQAISTATGAYCKARQMIPKEVPQQLCRHVAKRMAEHIPNKWRFKGRRVLLVDGTTVKMPDTVENQEVFPQPSTQKPGLGFPICRIVGITSLETGAIVNAEVGPYSGKGSGESALLRQMYHTFEAGDLILGDAMFGSYYFLAEMYSRGVDVVFEQMGARKTKTDFNEGIKLGQADHLVELHKPKVRPQWMSQEAYQRLPDKLRIRELLADGKHLITTMCNAKAVTKRALAKLYKQRWSVEIDIRHIKTTMGMAMLSCKTPEMVIKELWVYLLAYNLIRLLMMQSALLNNIKPRNISFKHSIQLWLTWLNIGVVADKQATEAFFNLIAQRRVGLRPGRIEPRAVKLRPKPYPLLVRPRDEARAEVKQNGHPNKAK